MKAKRYIIKFSHWEFWPTWLVYIPVLFMYPLWALRCRSIFFFAYTNPGLEMGGLYGSGKYNSLQRLALELVPNMLRFEAGVSIVEVEQGMKRQGLLLPVVVKPDFGERGQGVDLIHHASQLAYAVSSQTSAFLIQEYLNFPFEAGVFYIRKPNETKGKVTSIVVKGFLHIVGDGVQTVEALALKNKRSFLIWDDLRNNLDVPLGYVPRAGEVVVLEAIGNHNRGTSFHNGANLITPEVEAWAESVARQIPGFYYGRFDLRAPDQTHFMQGKGIKIMEVNGANAEPAHIYEEGFPLFKGIVTLLKYWNTIASIAYQNRSGLPPITFAQAHFYYSRWRTIRKEKWNRVPYTPVLTQPETAA